MPSDHTTGDDTGDDTINQRPPRRVLVVEDEDALRRVMVRTLQRDGLVVLAVGTIAEAEEVLRRVRPHLVVLDRRIGDDDGFALMRRLRAELGDAGPAWLLCSGAGADPGELGFDEAVGRVEGVGGEGGEGGEGKGVRVLPKPFTPALLVEAVMAALG